MNTTAYDECIQYTSELIRIDTSNFGPGHDGPGERPAAEYIAAKLEEVGVHTDIYESEPRRATLVANWEPAGCDTSLSPLLVHGHTDVVPAVPEDWAVHPFSGEIKDDCVWGRGAVDMKDFDAMVLAVVRDRIRTSRPSRRPIRLIFTADEECGSPLGANWLTEHHPELIADCQQAVGEVGGFSITAGQRRMYLIQTAEKGLAWLKLIVDGTAGHGSMRNADNAVTELARAVADLGSYQWPVQLHPAQQAFLDSVGQALGVQITADTVEQTLAQLGSIARMVGATMGHTANPTMLEAGYKANVIPGQASAVVDGRYIPGRREEFFETVRRVVGDKVRVEILHEQPGVETDWGTSLTEAMTAAVTQFDPEAMMTPYIMSGGTDAKGWNRLGVQCFGFVPLKLPPELDFVGMFHGVDERVPVQSLRFGVDVFDRFLDLA